ncbi:hypothetical protein LZ31DRAFT_228483 [Colletotrichum somersetense]|nr:hypothetical protein LZ31DRAFT_228483 [Colletotrichum somersetense]
MLCSFPGSATIHGIGPEGRECIIRHFNHQPLHKGRPFGHPRRPPNNPFLFSSRTKAVPPPWSPPLPPGTPLLSHPWSFIPLLLLPPPSCPRMQMYVHVGCQPFLSQPCIPTTEEASYRPPSTPSRLMP